MGDLGCGYSHDETLKVIACADPNHEYQFIVPRHILCISPVLRGYIEEPDTTPPGLKRNGEGSLTLNSDGKVVDALLDYLRQAHGDKKFTLPSSDFGAIFCIQVYKLALSLGLKDLCTTTLQSLRSQTRGVDDFVKAALEAWQLNLIDGEEIRGWFTTYINQRHEDLLKILNGDDDVLKFCSILVSALAHAKNDYQRCDPSMPSNLPPTPPSSSLRKSKKDLGLNSLKHLSSSPLEGKDTLGSDAKKRKLHAYVEDASESDQDPKEH